MKIIIPSLLFASFLFSFSGIIAQEENIILKTTTGDIDGTLMLPEIKQNIPVVLIIAGSGPTDRNGNNDAMENNAYKYLAEALGKNGIASVRYDKRGIGRSQDAMVSESDVRFETYINDVKSWVEMLAKDKRFSRIIIAGHSEGSLLGMIAAENNKNVAAYISIAGAGRPADRILKEQLAESPQKVKDMVFPMIDTLKKGDTIQDVPKYFYSLFRPSIQPYMISWFKYNPQDEIKKLTIPVLIVQGLNDLQVTKEDADLLAKANPAAKLVLIEKMNHVLKIVEGDKKANKRAYDNPDLPLADAFVKAVISFLKS